MRLRRGNHNEGVTLVEIIVSIVLITIVSVVCLEFLAQFLKMALMTPSQTVAVNYGQQGMENLYMSGYRESGQDNPVTGMNRTWTTTHSANPGNDDYAVITVNVNS